MPFASELLENFRRRFPNDMFSMFNTIMCILQEGLSNKYAYDRYKLHITHNNNDILLNMSFRRTLRYYNKLLKTYCMVTVFNYVLNIV